MRSTCGKSSCDRDSSLSSKYYKPHAFYRKHFWCFSTFRTKNIHIYLVCCCQRTSYDRYFLSSKYYEPYAFYRKHFWCFSTFWKKNIHIYLVCCCQRTCYDRDSLSTKYYEPHAFYRKHFWCLTTFRTKNIHISCVAARAHLLRSIFPFEHLFRAARVL